jgi:hypothetical protein
LGWAAPDEADNCEILYGDPWDLSCDAVMAAVNQVTAGRMVEL